MPSTSQSRLLVVLVACLLLVPTGIAATTPTATEAGSTTTESLTCTAGGPAAASEAGSGNVSVRTYVAPGRTFDDLRNASALARLRANDLLTPASVGVDRTWDERVVALRDVAVVQFTLNGSATGLLDRLAAQNQVSPTANFRALVSGSGVDFTYIGASACPPTLALNASIENGSFRVLVDRENDTLSLVLDVDRLLFVPPGGGEPTRDTYVEGHNGFDLTIRESTGLVAENTTASGHFTLDEARVSFGEDHVGLARVGPGNWTLTGETTLAPGSHVTVVLRPYTASGGTVTVNATVDSTRRIVTELSAAELDGNATYRLIVPELSDPTSAQDTPVLLVVGNASTADVRAENETTTGEIYYGPTVTTTDGGFVVLRNASGGIVGVSEYIEPGWQVAQPHLSPVLDEPQTLTATVYRDVNGNQEFDGADEPYRANGSVVRDTAYVRIDYDDRDTTTTTRPSTRTTTGPTSTAGTSSTTLDTTDRTGTTTGTTPGFGLAVSLLALVALTLALARRA